MIVISKNVTLICQLTNHCMKAMICELQGIFCIIYGLNFAYITREVDSRGYLQGLSTYYTSLPILSLHC